MDVPVHSLEHGVLYVQRHDSESDTGVTWKSVIKNAELLIAQESKLCSHV